MLNFMRPFVVSTHELVAVRDIARPDATVALQVDHDTIQVLCEAERERQAVIVTGQPGPARRIADELARSLGARVRYVDEATACAAALDDSDGLLLHWSNCLSVSVAGTPRSTVGATFGHLGVDPHGPPCPCGGRGCLQDEVGGSALAAQFAQVTERAVSVDELATLARCGDAVAARLVGSAAAVVARQLAPVCASARLGRVTVAGPLASAGAALCDRLRDELQLFWPAPMDVIAFDPMGALRGALTIARRG